MIRPIDIVVGCLVVAILWFIAISIWRSQWMWTYRAEYLDHDPYWQETYERTLYEYRVTHLNGNVRYVWAHMKTTDGAFASFHEADDTTWNRLTVSESSDYAGKPWGGTRGHDTLIELEGIESIQKSEIGKHVWTIDCDRRDRSVAQVTRRFESP